MQYIFSTTMCDGRTSSEIYSTKKAWKMCGKCSIEIWTCDTLRLATAEKYNSSWRYKRRWREATEYSEGNLSRTFRFISCCLLCLLACLKQLVNYFLINFPSIDRSITHTHQLWTTPITKSDTFFYFVLFCLLLQCIALHVLHVSVVGVVDVVRCRRARRWLASTERIEIEQPKEVSYVQHFFFFGCGAPLKKGHSVRHTHSK